MPPDYALNGKSRDMAATLAHEIMHLYGGEELYTSRARYEMAMKLYKNDIMCLEARDLRLLNVGGFTAYAVGWTDGTPGVCGYDAWYRGCLGYDG